MSKKHQEEQAVHEHDAFIKMMIGLKDGVLAKQKVLTSALFVIVAGLVAIAILSALSEQQADAQLNTADAARTIEEMEAAVAECPDDVGLHLRLARAYGAREKKKEGDEQKIYDLLQRAAAAADTDLDKTVTALALGKVEMDMKKYEDALGHFNDATAAQPLQELASDEANCYAGLCLEKLGQSKEALERYERVGQLSAGQQSATPWKAFADFRQAELRHESRD